MRQLTIFDALTSGQNGPLLGVNHYACEADAIAVEDSNDAVHIIYADKLMRQVKLFLNGFQGDCLYAMKANPNESLLKFLWQSGLRKFEMASLREVEYLSDILPDAELFFMHPIKSRKAIRKSYELGVRNFAYDSLEELRKIESETENADDLSLFLRVRVEQTNAAHPLSGKFGASMQEAALLLQRAAQSARTLGVTFHVGSQCMDSDAYRAAIENVAGMIENSGVSVQKIDVGGGFPVPYPGMTPADLTDYFDVIHKALVTNGLSDKEILCEPGRALVGEAGAVAVRVEMRKGQNLYINDGTYGALFDAGVPGWSYPLEVISGRNKKHSNAEKIPFKLFGPTCDSLDVMEGPFELPDDIEEGDWILFKNLGAYGFAMQTRFNGFYSETTVSVEG